MYFFIAYHLYLISVNTTTNETNKWNRFKRTQKELSKNQAQKNKKKDLLNKAPVPRKITNIYNRGIIQNFYEVFFPLDQFTRHPTNIERKKN